MKKMFLTGGIILSILPLTAKAEFNPGSGTLSLDGLIRAGSEDGCSAGVFDTVNNNGTVSMTPNYIPAAAKGQYLDVAAGATLANADTTVTTPLCPENYYCGGVSEIPADATSVTSTGFVLCETVAGGLYPYSDEGAESETACYKTCNATDSTVPVVSSENAAGYEVLGADKVYYKSGDFCERNVSLCTTPGYTKTNIGTLITEKLPTKLYDAVTPVDNVDVVSLDGIIGADTGLDKGDWKITLAVAPVTGVSGVLKCTNSNSDASAENFTGPNCWIQVQKINSVSIHGTAQLVHTYADENDCVEHCGVDDNFDKSKIVASIGNRNVCMANKIVLTWNTPEGYEGEKPAYCMYGEGLSLPDPDPSEDNKTFVGWRPDAE